MYYQAVAQCAQALRNLEILLDKAEKHATEKGIDVNILLTGRLAPDMLPFTYQIQSACDYVKAAAAWLSGQTPPKHEDTESTVSELRARIQKTVAFVSGIREENYESAASQSVKLSWVPSKVLIGMDYLLQMTIPNVYFHASMAYAILRQSGVEVGKMDFLGPVNFKDIPT